SEYLKGLIQPGSKCSRRSIEISRDNLSERNSLLCPDRPCIMLHRKVFSQRTRLRGTVTIQQLLKRLGLMKSLVMISGDLSFLAQSLSCSCSTVCEQFLGCSPAEGFWVTKLD